MKLSSAVQICDRSVQVTSQERRAGRWFAVDWGTTNLRAWCLDPSGKLLQSYASDCGAGSLGSQEFESALLDLIQFDLPAQGAVDVFCCGMVGAQQGWVDASYRKVPASAKVSPGDLTVFMGKSGRLRVHIVPGVSQSDPPDVMRGEETQMAGYQSLGIHQEVSICCPGTHSKWAVVRRAGIESFKTLPTGEVFALLSRNSILRHSIAVDAIDTDVFQAAVRKASSAPEAVFSHLFPIRARDVLQGQSKTVAGSHLSGLLIGLELANARSFWQERPTVLIGTDELAGLYQMALQTLGVKAEIVDGGDMARAGLVAVRNAVLATTV